MSVYLRQIHCQVSIDGYVVPDVISARCSFAVNSPVARAEVTLRSLPAKADDNKPLEIRMGATPGTGAALRFKGRMRSPAYTLDRRVTIQGVGELNKAEEYFNFEDPMFVGGLCVGDLAGTSVPPDPTSTAPIDRTSVLAKVRASTIIAAVLTKCGITPNMGNIHDTGRLYGWIAFENFVWEAGTPADPQNISQFYQDAGQSGLDYIRTYNRIEAEYEEDVSPTGKVSNPRGGFYKIMESLGGEIFVVRVGGRPRGTVDNTGGTPHVLVEGVNITDGRITRAYPIANTVLVKGYDYGDGYGPVTYTLQGSNGLMGSFRYSDPSAPSSSMIEHADRATADIAGFGMDCETVANARMLEVNRITVNGSVTTPEDWLFGPAQTVLVAGTFNPVTFNTLQGRLGTNEKLFVDSLTIECSSNNNAPVFRQTLTLVGGGWPDQMPYPPA